MERSIPGHPDGAVFVWALEGCFGRLPCLFSKEGGSMKRLFVTILGIFVLAGAGCSSEQAGKVSVEATELATQVRVVSSWVPPAGVDSIVVATSLVSNVVNHTLVGTATRDTAFFPITLVSPGVPAAGQVSVQAKRRGLLSPPVTTNYSFTRSDVPPAAPTGVTANADSV